MPLQPQLINIPFALGLDTKTDSKQVLKGRCINLQNVTFISPQKYSKRNGYLPLPSLTNGVALSVLDNQLVALDSLNIWSYSEAESSWYNQGVKQTCSVYQQNVFSPKFAPELVTTSVSALTTLSTYGDTSGGSIIQYSIIDNLTDKPLFSALSALPAGHTAGNRMTITTGNNYNLIYEDILSGVIHVSYIGINASTGVASAPVNLLLESTTNLLDLCQNQAGTSSYITYSPSGGTTLGIAKLNTSTSTITVTSTASIASVATGTAIAYDSINNYVWVFYVDGSSNLNYAIYDANLSVILAPTLIAASAGFQITAIVNGGQGLVFYSSSNISTATCTTSGVVSASVLMSSAHTLYSKPFVVTPASGSTSYIHIAIFFQSQVQNTGFIIRYTGPSSFQVVAQIAPGRLFYLGGTGMLPSLAQVSANVFSLPYTQVVLASTINPGNLGGSSSFSVTNAIIDFSTKPQKESLANNLMFTGGFLSSYDGTTNFEQNFFLFPEGIASGPVSGGAMSVGVYGYQATYEWIDALGQLQRSAPSPTVNVTTTVSDKQVLLQLPILYITNKTLSTESQINIVLYRTEANGTTFFKVASIPNIPASYGDITVNYSDNNSDASIVGNEQLYTTGGEVPNSTPPASDLVTTYKNRMILVPSENLLSWWYSKQVINSFPVEFSPLFVNNIDQTGGPITAVATLADNLIFFKLNNIFYVQGDGPAPSGVNNDFTYPQIIPTDCGCQDPNSVVAIPDGLIFKSVNGFQLLNRSFVTSYIGDKVEAYNNLTITSARNIPSSNRVYFTTNSNIALAYDYYVKEWAVFSNHSAIDSAIYKNLFTYLESSGAVMEETPGLYLDNTAPISIGFTTAWFSFADIQGYQRVWELLLLGQSFSNTIATIGIAYDFDPTIVQTVSIPVTSAKNPWQKRIFPKRERCESMQITFLESPQVTYGEGLNLSNLAFTFGIKKGLNKMGASKSYG